MKKQNRNMNTFTSTGMNVPQVGQGQSVHIHHQNQRPKGAMMGAGIMKNNTTNSMTTNSMMPTANSYPSSQSLVGGLHQMAPVNQMHTTSVAPPTVPLSSQNGTMGAPQIQPPPTNKMSPSMDQKQSSEIHGKTTSLQQQIQTSQQQQTQSSEQQLVEQALNLANTKEKTPMCLINELARYNKISHQYTLVDEEGPAHKKIFYVLLKLGDTEEYKASGPSIKKAQHAAAAVALEKTAYTHPPPKPPKTVQNNWITEGANNQPITPTVELNALAMKRGEQTVYKPIEARHQQPYYPPPNYNFRGMYNQRQVICIPVKRPRTSFTPFQRYHYPRMPRVFYVSLKVGQREFIGEGQTRQDARHDGAKKALNILKKLPIPNNIDLKPEKQVETTENEPYTPTDADNLKSEISLVHEIALRRNMNVSFDVTRESGPPHMKTFVTVCKVGEMETGAEGNSKKISKKKAAELMLDRLKELPPLPPSIIKQRVKPTVNKKKNKNIIKQMQKADPNYGVGINPISRLIQIQQAQQKKEPIYTLVTERGLPRRREFVIQVQVDDQTCNGVGPNKKLAKRHAAEAMLTLLGYNKPSPQPAKPAIKSATTPEGQTGEKKVTFQENSEEAASDALNHGKTGRQLMPGLLLLPDSNYPGGGQQTMNDALGFCNVPTRGRPELHLRDISNQHNLDIKFDEFQNSSQKANKEFMSRVSLLTNPPRVFHGSGMSAEAARDMAALEALKFLEDLGKGDGPQVKVEGDLVNSTSLGGAHTGRVPTM